MNGVCAQTGQAPHAQDASPLTAYLRLMARRGASDLFFSPGAPVHIKVDGLAAPLGRRPLPPGAVARLAYPMLSEVQRRRFERALELNLAVDLPGAGRFRLNLYRARGQTAMAVRHLTDVIPSPDDLHLPAVIKGLALAPRGLVLITGATGSGKTTTLASLIDYRNARAGGHIVTVEEPIEYLHRHRRAVVDQREIGLDTLSYAAALKSALRQAPDVIAIGEIRDRRTVRHAVACAETGHLCLATLHAGGAVQALERMVEAFPAAEQQALRRRLALVLVAVVSQRLLRGVEGKRRPAVEVLINSPYVASSVEKGDTPRIHEAMRQGTQYGMRTFQQDLVALHAAGVISLKEALAHADSRTELMLSVRLGNGRGNDKLI